MSSYLEQQIEKLRSEEFGPDDPRTPSLASVPGGPLSKENERKILEGQLREEQYLDFLRQRSRSEAKEYWSDKKNLRIKLDRVVLAMKDAKLGEIGELAREVGIVEGRGEVFKLKKLQSGIIDCQVVDIDIPEKNMLYISPYHSVLSMEKQQKLRFLPELV